MSEWVWGVEEALVGLGALEVSASEVSEEKWEEEAEEAAAVEVEVLAVEVWTRRQMKRKEFGIPDLSQNNNIQQAPG